MSNQRTVHILYTKISDELREDVDKKYLIFLPDSLRTQYFRYRRWQDRAASLYSKILLVKGLQKFGFDYSSLEKLTYNQYGRPSLPGQIDFNISHSGNYILCVVGAEVKLGIDIEEIKPVDFSDFENLMTAEQWNAIKSSRNPLQTFFKFWAIKESIIKADGRGLSVPLNDIMITEHMAYYENRWYLKELNFDENYCANLASNLENLILNIEYVDMAIC